VESMRCWPSSTGSLSGLAAAHLIAAKKVAASRAAAVVTLFCEGEKYIRNISRDDEVRVQRREIRLICSPFRLPGVSRADVDVSCRMKPVATKNTHLFTDEGEP
jgi:hypothetical protein